MFDPAQLTLGQVSSALRDFTVVGVLLTVAWKSRGMYETAKDFFERLTTHMDAMEDGMQTLLTNHLTHIEDYMKKVSDRQVRSTLRQKAQYTADDQDAFILTDDEK